MIGWVQWIHKSHREKILDGRETNKVKHNQSDNTIRHPDQHDEDNLIKL